MRFWDTSAIIPLLLNEPYSVALRAADSVQLSAALFGSEEIGAPLEFVCLDRRLRGAAMMEGLLPVPGLRGPGAIRLP